VDVDHWHELEAILQAGHIEAFVRPAVRDGEIARWRWRPGVQLSPGVQMGTARLIAGYRALERMFMAI
jgi:hypothetical protein